MPGSDYNLARCERYLKNQAASSIKAYSLAKGLDPIQLFTEFMRVGIKLNDKQKAMVRMALGDNFVFDDEEGYDLPFDLKKPQNQDDLINHILRSE